jgi:protein-S-isoprenylcysteine O-methyltransferase Ste14
MRRPTRAGLAEAGTNLALALLYASFAWAHLQAFRLHPRPSLVLLVLMEALIAVLVVVRERSTRTSFSPGAWLTTLGGTFAPLLLRPAEVARDAWLGDVVQAGAFLFAVGSVLSLQRSFGLLPAVRGIRTAGAYRLVRHPLYAAYTLANLGYLASNWTARNALLVAVALAFQVLRIRNEERLLTTVPAYAAYRARVRWRLVPFVY